MNFGIFSWLSIFCYFLLWAFHFPWSCGMLSAHTFQSISLAVSNFGTNILHSKRNFVLSIKICHGLLSTLIMYCIWYIYKFSLSLKLGYVSGFPCFYDYGSWCSTFRTVDLQHFFSSRCKISSSAKFGKVNKLAISLIQENSPWKSSCSCLYLRFIN